MKHGLVILALLVSATPSQADAAAVHRRYTPTDAEITNPERGLYVQLADRRGRPLRAVKLRELRDDHITLVLRLYYLKDYRNRPLDRVQLDLIARDFATLRATGMKAIVRFAYSSRIGEPDAPLDVVRQHLAQVGPLLREHADLIVTVQAGFIGAWGEWHASTNGLAEPEAMRQIATALLESLPANRTIQVRTPLQKQRIVGARAPLSADTLERDSLAARIGHHNDCFLADETDVGTYRDRRLEADRAYTAADSRFVPVGGETCRNGPRSDPEFARQELARMHWSFLNLAYHRGVIAKWREEGFLDEVRRKLGYRLRLVSARLPGELTPGEPFGGVIVVANDGWAAPIHDRPVELLLVDTEGTPQLSYRLAVDLRDAQPGPSHEWPVRIVAPSDLRPGTYSVRLRLADPSPRLRGDARYAIRLANTEWAPRPDGSSDLGIEIVIPPRHAAKP